MKILKTGTRKIITNKVKTFHFRACANKLNTKFTEIRFAEIAHTRFEGEPAIAAMHGPHILVRGGN